MSGRWFVTQTGASPAAVPTSLVKDVAQLQLTERSATLHDQASDTHTAAITTAAASKTAHCNSPEWYYHCWQQVQQLHGLVELVLEHASSYCLKSSRDVSQLDCEYLHQI